MQPKEECWSKSEHATAKCTKELYYREIKCCPLTLEVRKLSREGKKEFHRCVTQTDSSGLCVYPRYVTMTTAHLSQVYTASLHRKLSVLNSHYISSLILFSMHCVRAFTLGWSAAPLTGTRLPSPISNLVIPTTNTFVQQTVDQL